VFIRQHAYYCDFGTDAEACLSQRPATARAGLERACDELGRSRRLHLNPRSTLLAAAAVRRCLEGLGGGGHVAIEKLPVFFACGTGLGAPALYVLAAVNAGVDADDLESALFSPAGPHMADTVRYTEPMLGGLIAQLSGLKGENRSLVGTSAGAIALRQAARMLASGRTQEAMVVCGESLAEWPDERRTAPSRSGPSEIGCAFYLSTRPSPGCTRLVGPESGGCRASAVPPFAYFEAANAPANLCWALEQSASPTATFAERDRHGREWIYGIRSAWAGAA
jgi:hypothetical protein